MTSFELFPDRKDLKDSESLNTSNSYDEITLEYVSGVSAASKNAIALNRANGNVAFIASSVLALFDPRFSHQAFIENPSSREIKSVTFSDDGRFLAFGENGVNPSVSVYNAKLFTHISRFQVEERKCAIKALRFHPRSIYLALLLAHDYTILVYEFIHGRKLAAARWCVEPLAMTMTKTESILAVCGHRKISCFSLSNVESTRYETNAVLDKRAVLLGKQGNYTFVDIASGQAKHAKSLYTVTACGYLCEIQTRGIFINHVVRISERCFCVGYELGMLFVGCEKGVVSLCNPSDLTVIANVSDHDMFGNDKLHPMHWDVKSDIIALVVNPKTKIVTTLKADQKMHSWSVDFGADAVECSPVITADDDNKSCPMSKVITSHDMQCTLAQLLLQLELRNDRQNEAACFLQRPSSFRNKQINAIKITPDGKEIIVGTKEGEIKIYEATSGRLTKVIEAHSAEVTFIDMMYDDDFKLVATGGRDRLLFILDASKSYKHVQTINDHSSAIVSISLAHNKGVLTLISSSADGVILIRRAGKEGKTVFNIVGELPEFVGCKKRVYNHSSGYIITGQERGRINVFPADPKINLKPMRKLQVGSALLKTVTIDPTGSFFIACSKEGQYVFHLQSGQQIATLCTIPGFHHLSFSQDLNYFINSNDAGCKFLWRLPSKVVDVMKAKMSINSKISETNTCEFFYNSYESYFRVCQQLVKQEKNLTTESSEKFESDMEDNNMYADGKVIGNLLEDRIRLVDSESYTSCTSYSRSLTDLTQGMDLCGDFQQPACDKRFGGKTNENNYDPGESASEIFANDCPRANSSGGTVISIPASQKSKSQKCKEDNKPDQESSAGTIAQLDHLIHPSLFSDSSVQNEMLPVRTSIRVNKETPHKESGLLPDIKTLKSPRARINKISVLPSPESFSSEVELKCGFQSANRKGKWGFKTKDIVETKEEPEKFEPVVEEMQEEMIQDKEGEKKLLKNCEKSPELVKHSKQAVKPTQQVVKSTQQIKENADFEYENRSDKEITADSGVISPTSSMTFKQSGQSTHLKPIPSSSDEQLKEFNNRYKTIHLSNSQETYIMKNVDLYTPISIINGLTAQTPAGCAINPNTDGSNPQNTLSKTPSTTGDKTNRRATFSPEKIVRENSILSSKSNVNEGDSEIYCQDSHLRKVLLSWALKKLHKERMRRKLKSVNIEKPLTSGESPHVVRIAPMFRSRSPETSTESQPTGTSELSDISDISACTVMLSSNSTVTDSESKNNLKSRVIREDSITGLAEQSLRFIKNDGAKTSIKARASIMKKSSTPVYENIMFTPPQASKEQQMDSKINLEQLSPSKLGKLSKAAQQKLVGDRAALVSPRAALVSPRASLKTMQKVRDAINNQQDEEFEPALPEQSNGAMADLFRSQDNYLRKLKEVRQNFEKSIQALSAERENQRLEAQKYLGKPLS